MTPPTFDPAQLQALLEGRVPQGDNTLARDWRGASGGSCFHRALDVWVTQQQQQDFGWRIALGVMAANEFSSGRHVHAWMERGRLAHSAVNRWYGDRDEFYERLCIERDTVGRVNPRAIWRRYRGEWTRDAINELLNMWGKPWTVRDGGVFPA